MHATSLLDSNNPYNAVTQSFSAYFKTALKQQLNSYSICQQILLSPFNPQLSICRCMRCRQINRFVRQSLNAHTRHDPKPTTG